MKVRLKHERLAREIARSRMTQNRWAQKLGLSRGHLSNLVNGRFVYPSPETRARLMQGLGLDFDDLFEIELPVGEAGPPDLPAGRLQAVRAARRRRRMHISAISQDLKFGLRKLGRQPLSSAMAILTLALGIAVNVSVFSLVNAALFRPLPVEGLESLVNIYTSRADGTGFNPNSVPDFLDLPHDPQVFQDILGYGGLMASITEEGSAEMVFGEMVTSNYFQMLGLHPALGRPFLEKEGREGAEPVVLISHGLWQRRFGGSPEVLERSLPLNGRPFRIVGVAPLSFQGMLARGIPMDLWVPLNWAAFFRSESGADTGTGLGQGQRRSNHWLHVKARLAEGAGIEAAREFLGQTAQELERRYPESNKGRRFRVRPTSSVTFHPEGDRAVNILAALLMGGAGLVLLTACSNIANLLLAQTTRRRRELGVRSALGAGRLRLTLQLMCESLVLALAGGLAGGLLSLWFSRLLVQFNPPLPVPLRLDLEMDWRVILFAGLLTVLAGVFLGLIPALTSLRRHLGDSLKQTPEQSPRGRLPRLGNAFLLPQLAISLCLLIAAGLLARSLIQAGRTQPGFDVERTAMVALQLGQSGYDEPSAHSFYERLQQQVEALPEVESAALTNWIPLSAIYGSSSTVVWKDQTSAVVQAGGVGEAFFKTLGIAILRGRPLRNSDLRGGSHAAVVSASLAERLWPGQDPLGRRFRQNGPDGPWREVVGVAADVKVQTLGEQEEGMVYRPLDAGYTGLLRLVLRSRASPSGLLPAVRQMIADQDDRVALFEAKTMSRHMDLVLFPFRMAAAMGACLAGFALLLSLLGLSGAASLAVSRRFREMGIRIALGSSAGDAARLVVRDGMKTALWGLGLGLPAAWGVSRLLASWLFGIQPFDPLIFVLAPGVLLAAAWVAICLPARRLREIEPADLLRVR